MLIDGQPARSIPADDRGLLYGDLLFETIAFYRGRAPLWEYHWRRLASDGSRLGLTVPESNTVRSECLRLIDGVERAVIRLSLTRGSGGRAYEPPETPRCRRILMLKPWPARIHRQREQGVTAITGSLRLASGSALAGMKHGNRLEQVLAARECRDSGAEEAMLFDTQDRLVEAVSANVVLVVEGRAVSPATTAAGVAGVGLKWLMDQPECNIRTGVLKADDLARAEEIVVINSVAGIRPVVRLDGRPLEPGILTRQWQRLWMERLGH